MPYAPPPQGDTWTVAELLQEVRDLARIPSASDYTDAKLLAFANRAIRSAITEVVLNGTALGGRLLDYQDVNVSDGFRAGSEYLVPNTSASGTLSHVEWFASEDAKATKVHQTTAIEVPDLDGFDSDEGAPSHWYFKGGRIALVPAPAPTSGARLRIWFPRAHPKLVVTTDNVVTVSNYTAAARAITIGSTEPAGWPSTAYAVDIYSGYAPHDHLVTRLPITSGSGTTLTHSADVSDDVVSDLSTVTLVGQPGRFRLALTGTSDCVQLPDSMRDAVTKRVCLPIMRSLGSHAEADKWWGESREELGTVQRQLSPRGKASRPTVINRGSILRRRRRTW